jgi:hypothetical protein
MNKSLIEQAIQLLDPISSNTSLNPREDAHQAIALLTQYLNTSNQTHNETIISNKSK